MLETIREFARDRLVAEGEEAEAERRHADYFLGLAEEAEPELTGPQSGEWLARLELEHDNLRAALGSSLHSGSSEVALRLACAVWRFWHTHGHLAEGEMWLRLSLEAADEPPPAFEARALAATARLAVHLGKLEEARSFAEQSVELFRVHGDLADVLDALNVLSFILSSEGDQEAAESIWEEVGELARKSGDRRREASAAINLGYLALMRRDFGRAERLSRRSQELFAELKEHAGEGFALINVALVELHRDRPCEAVEAINEGLAACAEVGSKQGIGYCLEVLGAAALEFDRPVDAARLLAHAQRLRDEAGVELEPYEQTLHDSTAARSREAVGSEDFAREGRHGREMTLDEACAYAFDLCARLRDGQEADR